MPENIPNLPGGAIPPKKETGKVQPKKETVRINLPPKPSAAPTIKLPTLPPGGQAAGPGAPAPASHAAPAAAPAARAAAAPVAAQRPSAPATPAAKAAAPYRPPTPALSSVDVGLAVGAAVAGVAAVGTTLYLLLAVIS